MIKKVLIAGASTYGVKNLGDDAMFLSLCDGLRVAFPESEIVFAARHPDSDFDKFFGVRSIKNFEHTSKDASRGRFFYGFNRGDQREDLHRLRDEIQSSDLIIIGGNSFMEISPSDILRGVPTYSSLFAQWAILFDKPYALYGVAVHEIKNEITKQSARFLCENAKVVTVREQASVDNLRSCGVVAGNFEICQDPAYGLEPVSNDKLATKILDIERIAFKTDHVIGIGFRHMYWQWDDKKADTYSRKMAELCDRIVDKTDADLIFIPNCTYHVDTANEDDRVIAERVCGYMKRGDRAKQIRGDYNLTEILSLFSQLSLHISNRRHSTIFGAIHNVPVVSIASGNRYHFDPFMAELGLFGYVVDFILEDVPTMENIILRAWSERVHLKERLSAAVPPLRMSAKRHVETIARYL